MLSDSDNIKLNKKWEQLQRVNQHLNDVEGRMDTGTQYSKGKHGGAKGKKLSSTSHKHVKGNIVSDRELSDDNPYPV